jgi:hypothetical protein
MIIDTMHDARVLYDRYEDRAFNTYAGAKVLAGFDPDAPPPLDKLGRVVEALDQIWLLHTAGLLYITPDVDQMALTVDGVAVARRQLVPAP